MPVFPTLEEINYKGRTNTNLVVSEGDAPAEKYLAADGLEVQFQYAFGPEGNQGVIIPKGKIVKADGLVYDVVTEKHIPSISYCGDGEIPLGVNQHNVYELKRDRFSGNSITVLTREYIRLPLFYNEDAATSEALADSIKYGAAWTDGTAENFYGKYVVSDANGNFRLYDGDNDDPMSVIGQVYGVEADLPPAGFLQYFMEMSDNEYLQFIKDTQIVPSAGRTKDKANTLSIDTFPTGVGYMKDRKALAKILKDFRAGIPFLTDGYFKARVNDTMNTVDDVDGKIHSMKYTGNIVVDNDGKFDCSDYVGSMLFIKLRDELTKDSIPSDMDINNLPELAGQTPGHITVSMDYKATENGQLVENEAISSKNIHVDYENNLLVIYFTKNVFEAVIKIGATVLQNQVPGIPTYWDFKGAIGEARILLMK